MEDPIPRIGFPTSSWRLPEIQVQRDAVIQLHQTKGPIIKEPLEGIIRKELEADSSGTIRSGCWGGRGVVHGSILATVLSSERCQGGIRNFEPCASNSPRSGHAFLHTLRMAI